MRAGVSLFILNRHAAVQPMPTLKLIKNHHDQVAVLLVVLLGVDGALS
jgi:hypothetical protein